MGRFTQPDTIIPNPSNPQDLNRYTYVRNNPVRYTDPSGNDPCANGSGGCGLLSAGNDGSRTGSVETAFDLFEGRLWGYWRQSGGNFGSFIDTAAPQIAGIEIGNTPWPIARGVQGRIPGDDPTRRISPLSPILGESGWRVGLVDGDGSPARHFFAFLAIASANGTAAAVFGLEENEASGLPGSSLQDLRSGYAAIALAARSGGLDTPFNDQQFGVFIGDLRAVAGDASRVSPLDTSFAEVAIPVSERPGGGGVILREQQAYFGQRYPSQAGP